jgi:hypothetical protein
VQLQGEEDHRDLRVGREDQGGRRDLRVGREDQGGHRDREEPVGQVAHHDPRVEGEGQEDLREEGVAQEDRRVAGVGQEDHHDLPREEGEDRRDLQVWLQVHLPLIYKR